ncbi:MAG: hypothetical protein MUC50_20865 [Myxococcota bacterium]|nr:hypothetical protein [Myxococcota bacterium]
MPFDDVPRARDQVVDIRRAVWERNRRELEGVLSNNASGTAEGLLWVQTAKGYIDPAAFQPGQRIEVLEVNRRLRFQKMRSELKPGLYTVTSAGFHQSRCCYRIRIGDEKGPCEDPLGMGAVQFRLVD